MGCFNAEVPKGLAKVCLMKAKEIVEPLFRIINERSFTWGDHGVAGEEILAHYYSFWVPCAHTKDLPLRGSVPKPPVCREYIWTIQPLNLLPTHKNNVMSQVQIEFMDGLL